MEIAFFSNFIDHHTAPLCKELYRLTSGRFYYLELTEMPDSFKNAGYPDFSSLPFVIPVWKSPLLKEKAIELSKNVDVAIFNGYLTLEYAIVRAKIGKLSFELGERVLKKGLLNLLSPGLLKHQWYYQTLFHNKPFYRLSKSAYDADDHYFLHSYINRCYNWAYFTEVNEWGEIQPVNITGADESVSIMWCARFINWKHPELMIQMAKRLKEEGRAIKIDMYGTGKLLDSSKALCEKYGVDDIITFAGNIPNSDLVLQMRRHHIFVLTSDKREGWGAVVNEAMSNGCVIVGSDAAGSVPSLVEDKVNGLVFKSGDVESLTRCVSDLTEKPNKRRIMALNAFKTMKNVWSPQVGAERLIRLIECIQNGEETPYMFGPCSKQLPKKIVTNERHATSRWFRL